jgi:hypothetical protein
VKAAGAGVVLDEERIKSSLEESILSLLRDPGTLKLMGERGQQYVRENLTWAAATTSLIKCYDEVLACGLSRDPNC